MAAITKDQLDGTIVVRTNPGLYNQDADGVYMQDADEADRVSASFLLRRELQSVLADYDEKRAKIFNDKFNNLPAIRRELGNSLTGVLDKIETCVEKIASVSNLYESELRKGYTSSSNITKSNVDRRLDRANYREHAPSQSVYKSRSRVSSTRDYVKKGDNQSKRLFSSLDSSVRSVSISLKDSTKTLISNVEEIGRALVKGKYRGRHIILQGKQEEGFISKLLSGVKNLIALPVIGGVYTLLNGGSFADAAKNGAGLSGAYLGSKVGSMFGFPGRLAGALAGYLMGKGFLDDILSGKELKQSAKDAASTYLGLGGAALGAKYGAKVGGWKGAIVGGLAGGVGGYKGGQEGINSGLSSMLSILGAAGGFVAFTKGLKAWNNFVHGGTLDKITGTISTIGDIGKGFGRKSVAGYHGYRDTAGNVVGKTIGGVRGFHKQKEGIFGKIGSIYNMWAGEESSAINDADAAIGRGVRRPQSIWQRINELHYRLDAASGAIGRGRGGVGRGRAGRGDIAGDYGSSGGTNRRRRRRTINGPDLNSSSLNPSPSPVPPSPTPPPHGNRGGRRGSGGRRGGGRLLPGLKGKAAGLIAGGIAAVGSYFIPDMAMSAISGMIPSFKGVDNVTDSIENATSSLGQAADNLGNVAGNLGGAASSLSNLTDNLDIAGNLENVTGTLGNITGNLGGLAAKLGESVSSFSMTGGSLDSLGNLEKLENIDVKSLLNNATELTQKTTQKGLELLSKVDLKGLYNTTLQSSLSLGVAAATKIAGAASSVDYRQIISSVTGIDPDKVKLAPSFVKGQQELNNALKELGSGIKGAAEKAGKKLKETEKQVEKQIDQSFASSKDEDEGGFFSTLFKIAGLGGLGGLGFLGYKAFKSGAINKESISKLIPSKLPSIGTGGASSTTVGLKAVEKQGLLKSAGSLLKGSGLGLGLEVLFNLPDLLSGDRDTRASAIGGIAGGAIGSSAVGGLANFLPKRFQAAGKILGSIFGYMAGSSIGSDIAVSEQESGLVSSLGALGLLGGAGYFGYKKFGDKLPAGITDKIQGAKQLATEKLGDLGLFGRTKILDATVLPPDSAAISKALSLPVGSSNIQTATPTDIGSAGVGSKSIGGWFEQHKQAAQDKIGDLREKAAKRYEQFRQTETGQSIEKRYRKAQSQFEDFLKTERGQKLKDLYSQGKAKATSLYSQAPDRITEFGATEKGQKLRDLYAQSKAKATSLYSQASDKLSGFGLTERGQKLKDLYSQASDKLSGFGLAGQRQKLRDLYSQSKAKATSLYSQASDKIADFGSTERERLRDLYSQGKARASELSGQVINRVDDFRKSARFGKARRTSRFLYLQGKRKFRQGKRELDSLASEKGLDLQARYSALKEKAIDLYHTGAGRVSELVDVTREKASNLSAKATSAFATAEESKPSFERHKDFVKDKYARIKDKLADQFQSIRDTKFGAAAESKYKDVRSRFEQFISTEQGQKLKDLYSQGKAKATFLYSQASDRISEFGATEKGQKLRDLYSHARSMASDAYSRASNKFADLGALGKEGASFGSRLQGIRTGALNLYSAVSKKASSLYNRIRNRVSNIPASEMLIDVEAVPVSRGGANLPDTSSGLQQVSSRLDGITDKFKSLYAKTEKSFAGIGSKFSGLFGNVSSGFGKITTSFSGMFGGLKDKFSSLLPKSTEATSDNSSNSVDIDLPDKGKSKGKRKGGILRSFAKGPAKLTGKALLGSTKLAGKALWGGTKAVAKGSKSLLKGAGPLGVALGAMDLIPALMSGDKNEIAAAGGSAAGGAIGAALGSFIPIPVVGTLLGSMAGSWLGEKIGMGLFGETEEQKRSREAKESAEKTKEYLLSLKDKADDQVKFFENSNDPIADVKRRHAQESVALLKSTIDAKQSEIEANSFPWEAVATGAIGAAGIAGGAAYGAKKLVGATKSAGGKLVGATGKLLGSAKQSVTGITGSALSAGGKLLGSAKQSVTGIAGSALSGGSKLLGSAKQSVAGVTGSALSSSSKAVGATKSVGGKILDVVKHSKYGKVAAIAGGALGLLGLGSMLFSDEEQPQEQPISPIAQSNKRIQELNAQINEKVARDFPELKTAEGLKIGPNDGDAELQQLIKERHKEFNNYKLQVIRQSKGMNSPTETTEKKSSKSWFSSLFGVAEAHADDSLEDYKQTPEYKKALQENAERASNITKSELQGSPDATNVVSNVDSSSVGIPDATDITGSTSDSSLLHKLTTLGGLTSLVKDFTKDQEKTNKELLTNTDETNKVIQEAKSKGLFSRLWDKAKSFFGFGGGNEGGGGAGGAVRTASYESGMNTGVASVGGRGGGGSSSIPSNLKIPGSGELGALSARYESGNRGSSAVGYDTNGGTSYGKYQIAAATGTMGNYIKWLEGQTDNANAQEVARRLKAVDAAHDKGGKNQQAAAEWQALVAEGKMGNLEHDFIKATHYDVAYKQLSPEAQQMVANSKTLQDVLWSSSVHHGPGGKGKGAAYIFNKAYKSGMTESQMIDAVYQGRSDYVANNKYRDSLQKRFVNERQLAQAMLTNEKNAPAQNDAVTPQMIASNMPAPTGVGAATSQGLEAFAKTAVANKVTYSQAKGGSGRTIANGFIDCSGFGSEAMVNMMSSQTDSAGNKVYGDDALRFAQSMRNMTAMGQRAALSQKVSSFQLNSENMSQLKDGMYITMKRKNSRGGEEGHAGYVFRDSETGKWKFADSAMGGSWSGQNVTAGIKGGRGFGGVRISDLDEKLIAGARKSGWDFMGHDISQMSNQNATFDNMPKTALAENELAVATATAAVTPSPVVQKAVTPTDTQINQEVNSPVLSHASTSTSKPPVQTASNTVTNNVNKTPQSSSAMNKGFVASNSSSNQQNKRMISSPNVGMSGPVPSPSVISNSPDVFNPVTYIFDPIVQKYVNEPDENTMVQI